MKYFCSLLLLIPAKMQHYVPSNSPTKFSLVTFKGDLDKGEVICMLRQLLDMLINIISLSHCSPFYLCSSFCLCFPLINSLLVLFYIIMQLSLTMQFLFRWPCFRSYKSKSKFSHLQSFRKII